MAELPNAAEHANVFETSANEYSKAATPGQLERGVG